MNAPRYKVLEVSDAKDFCECCGKKNLKRVVFIEDTQTGVIQHFGTTCAAAPSKGFDVKAEIVKATKSFDAKRADLNQASHRKYRAAGGVYDRVDAITWSPADVSLYERCREEAKKEREAFYAGFSKI